MKRLLSIVLFCVLGSAGKSFALPPCPTSGVYDNCLGAWTFSGGETRLTPRQRYRQRDAGISVR